MDRESAGRRVRETFTQAFDETRFKLFVREVLHRYNEEKAFVCSHAYIKDAFKEHVNYFKRLGTFTSPDGEKLDILVVHLTDESKLERARTALRNFVAQHLKERDEKDAALAAFVSPTEKAWRFSYVKMEYVTEEKESGKIGVKQELTPARRYSYLVGEGESCHTAQSRFLDLLQDTSKDPALAEIEAAFSVETVTKEFFGSYAALFENLNAALQEIVKTDKTIGGEFKGKGVNTVDFAKKLLGQIVFLYFLQKKGWLGVPKGGAWGAGPRDFLRLAVREKFGAYRNFFNDILEPLFYDTLATERGDEAWCKRFGCRIPFLNGGLFEPFNGYDWRKTDILLPNSLFTNTEQTRTGDVGTGIFDVFDRYNFTVNEAEPLEKEVAIDPEMLGKVFENLIEENRRHGLGAFYTPREIVHYMCQEALINYLDVTVNVKEQKLAFGKPSQGVIFGSQEPKQELLTQPEYDEVVSRGDIEKFIRKGEQYSFFEAAKKAGTVGRDYPKPPPSIELNAEILDAKLAEITVCDPAVGSGAFPVGMMTEIVRARSVLTPYMPFKESRTAYAFKRHAIQDSLYGVDIDAGAVEIAKLRLWLSLVVDEENVQSIRPLPNLDYKIVAGNSLFGVDANLFNEVALRKLEALKLDIFNVADHDKKVDIKAQIDKLLDEVTHSKKVFDYWVYFSEVFSRRGGFDVTIGNPPYVRQEEFKELKPALKEEYTCYTGAADLLVYFFERSWQLLRPNGTHAFITSNKWLRSGYGEKLRSFLGKKTRVLRLIDFGDAPVFEAIAYPCVIVFQRTTDNYDSRSHVMTWQPGPPLEKFASVFAEKAISLAQRDLKPDGWRLEGAVVHRLLEKMRRAGKPLGEYVNGRFYRGILTGLNEAFVVDRATRDRLIREHASSKEVLKPFLRGRDVKRWGVEPQNLWLLFVPWHFPLQDDPAISGPSKAAEAAFDKRYPAIYAHLRSFKKELSARNQDETGIRYEWYALQRWAAEYWREFEQPKIIIPAITDALNYAPDTAKFYSNDKTNIVVTEAYRYVLGLLNSRVSMWFTRQTFATKQGGFFEFKPMYVTPFPIPAATPAQQHEIEQLVEKILAAKKEAPGAAVTAWEREIDARVYRLYGLTGDEIKVIEGEK